MKKKTYYKVVCNINNRLRSAWVVGAAELTYKVGVEIFPIIPKSKLFVFDNIESARAYPAGHEIYECEVTNPKVGKHMTNCYLDTMIKFWNLKANKKAIHKEIPCNETIKGTVFVDSVTLTKKVEAKT